MREAPSGREPSSNNCIVSLGAPYGVVMKSSTWPTSTQVSSSVIIISDLNRSWTSARPTLVLGLKWRPLHAIDQTRFREARLQAHYAVQWLARTARAYIPPRPDGSHTSLSWDRALDGFMTHPLRDGTRLTCRCPISSSRCTKIMGRQKSIHLLLVVAVRKRSVNG